MSIFPRTTVPGTPVVLHKRWMQLPPRTEAAVVRSTLQVRDPDGRVQTVGDDQLDLLPWHPVLRGRAPLHHAAQSPALDELFADALGAVVQRIESAPAGPHDLRSVTRSAMTTVLAERNADELLVQLLVLRASMHRYHTVPVPEDALLGRYEVLTSSWRDGRMPKNTTREHEWFLVERLVLDSLEPLDSGAATIRNDSPVECSAVAHRLVHRDGRAHVVDATPLCVPPQEPLRVPTGEGTVLLTYAEGRGRIVLLEDAHVPGRHPAIAWSCDDAGATTRPSLPLTVQLTAQPGSLHATEGRRAALDRGEAVVLTGDEACVWLAADGYQLSPLPSVARTLVAEGLLLEISTRT